MKTYIKEGFGYYDVTHYPIGGRFLRVGKDPMLIDKISNIPFTKGCNRIGYASNGMKVAFNSDSVKEAPDGQE